MKVLKYLILFTSLFFIVKIFYTNYPKLSESSIINFPQVISYIFFSGFFYILLLLSLGRGWAIIVAKLDGKNEINNVLIFIFIRSQLYKYIPGNIFHYANRQLIASKHDFSNSALLKSNILEAVNNLIAAFISSVFLYDVFISQYVFINTIKYFSLIVFLSSSLLFYMFYRNKIFSICLKSLPYYFIYFLGLGIMCFILVNYILELNISFFYCLSLYSIAWIAGYIIPGAPGGIGVRESIFIIMSSKVINPPQALLIITILRLTTTFGELVGYYLSNKKISSHH